MTIRNVQRLLHSATSYFGYGLANFRYPERKPVMKMIRRLKREREMLLTPVEAYQLFIAASATQKLDGDNAEVGVFRGASARLICEASPTKPLHLFDTFCGLPSPGHLDRGLKAGEFRAGLEDVKMYLRSQNNVHFHQGLFPGTADAVKDKHFAFVHLDMDLYEGTLEALQFFYRRMVPGGLILTHDYIYLPGPTMAFADFFRDKPEPIVELSGTQCIVMRTGLTHDNDIQ